MLTTVTYPHSVYQDYCTDWSIIRKCLHPTEVLHILSTQSTHKYLNIDAFIVFFFLLLTQGKAMKVISQWEQMNCLDVWVFSVHFSPDRRNCYSGLCEEMPGCWE